MARIYYSEEVDPQALAGQQIAVVGYGNQGRSWALNLRDSGHAVRVCVRADASREAAVEDGFEANEVTSASEADVLCILVPDDVIPALPIEPSPTSLSIVASGYCLAFDRFHPAGDAGLVAPRMLGPEVRRCYEEKLGFLTAVGVERDVTGTALARSLAIADGIGGLIQGGIEMTAKQEAVLDLAVEQVLSPALTHVNQAFVLTMLSQGIPMEAILTELFLSGEVERNYRLLREIGFADQLELHSPTSQYGQLSRRGAYDHLDMLATMQRLAADIAEGRFADEWDAESRAGHPKLAALKEQHAGPGVKALEDQTRRALRIPGGR